MYFSLNYSPGGCALNTSRVLSWLNADAAGIKIIFVGSTGEDELSTKLKDIITKDGVSTRQMRPLS